MDIKTPRIYLVKRSAVQSEAVQHALNINPVSDVLTVNAEDWDAIIAAGIGSRITALNGAPIAIVADFEHPLSVINDDSTVEILCPAPSQSNP